MKIWLPIVAVLLVSSCGKEEQPKPQQETQIQQAEVKGGQVLVSEAKELLDQAKERLKQEGLYGCCIKEACDYCALHESSCDCYEDLKVDRTVCIECYSGWQKGEGAVDTVRKEEVKTDFIDHKH